MRCREWQRLRGSGRERKQNKAGMNNKEHFDLLRETGFDLLPAQRVRALVDLLLAALHVPTKQSTEHSTLTRIDPGRLAAFGIDASEPVNWASLSCVEVSEETDGIFYVTIDEAMPGVCDTLVAYIEDYMLSWGWNVKVETEW